MPRRPAARARGKADGGFERAVRGHARGESIAGKFLAVAYRLQFDPRYREMQRLALQRVFGMPKLMRADIGFPLPRDDWRLSDDLSGGVLMEQGVYGVNAACNLAGEQPVEVVAQQTKSDFARFADVEESVFWSMQFANGAVAQCAASYTIRINELRVDAVSGFMELAPAYSAEGLRGSSTAGAIGGADVNQIALQLDDFAACIENGVPRSTARPRKACAMSEFLLRSRRVYGPAVPSRSGLNTTCSVAARVRGGVGYSRAEASNDRIVW